MPRGRPRKPVSPCQFCNTTFKRVEHLRRHERIHTREKPFRCECGQAFARKDLLTRHTKLSHHNIDRRVLSNVEVSLSEEDTNAQPHSAQPSSSIPNVHLSADPEVTSTNIPVIPEVSSAQSVTGLGDQCLRNDRRGTLDQLANYSYDQSNYNASPQFLVESTTGALDDVDLLWDWDLGAHDFLPATFFDPEQPLSDLWRPQVPHGELSTIPSFAIEGGAAIQDVSMRHPATVPPLYERLPPVEPDYELSNNERLPTQDLQPATIAEKQPELISRSPWDISLQAYKDTCGAFLPYTHLVDQNFLFPSRRSLSRFLEAYFIDFHQHLPFLHMPTTIFNTLAPELVLAMAAAGACYRFEDQKGYALYLASKAIITHNLTLQRLPYNTRHLSYGPRFSANNAFLNRDSAASIAEPGTNVPQLETATAHDWSYAQMQTMQALTIITALASWSDKPMSQDALVLSSQLAMLVREGGISVEDEIAEGTEWLEWIRREQRRRTLFVAYVLFNMQSIAFNTPPAILNQDVCLCLPHCGSEWEATSSSQFMHLRRMYGHDERSFKGALEEILHGRSVHTIGPLSAFGNYVLMVGLVQQIFLERHVLRSLSTKATSLAAENLRSYEAAFRSWHQSWEATQESSLDPSSPKGPLGFDAAALLWLGYIRLNADMGPYCDLMSKSPHTIAHTFVSKDTLRLIRSPHLDRAVLQCIHALSRPVRVGIPFVARTLASRRSIQQALCNLESAFLLSQWLSIIADAVAQEDIRSLREDERSLLGMVASLIKETDLASILEQSDSDDAKTIRHMAAASVRLWADTFSGPHVFHIVDTIGTTLSIVADILESSLSG